MPRLTRLSLTVPALLGLALLLGAAEADKKAGDADHKKDAAPVKAVCVLHPTKDSKVSGVVYFYQKGDDIEVSGEITGLTPGQHGFHVHEFGDCASPDGSSAGGHFDPDKKMHGGPHSDNRHVGDLGNITADSNGKATIKLTDKLIQLHGVHSIIGRSLVVHAKADDLKTQPSGDAGGRVAYGVIGVGKP